MRGGYQWVKCGSSNGSSAFQPHLPRQQTRQQQVARPAEGFAVFGKRDELLVHRLNENLETLPHCCRRQEGEYLVQGRAFYVVHCRPKAQRTESRH